ncbi:MAG: Zinc carboxypeptidase family protein [Candidatus Nomurabacteria bacterium GW2011_GWB1_37_5]|uniref:Zinc carboxypeptidase family protein n=1 Tax=Candidatus Nomurabacteria bacterium GW2011_GWB1_37_5 TaxID=1618742 RepID=A0A0G0K4Z2_9BACT|nr:MAG: Zinc carboxypeptidase family protein [Candidatus Nomurabacteria bacterium GW2011_GWB1_37_5]
MKNFLAIILFIIFLIPIQVSAEPFSIKNLFYQTDEGLGGIKIILFRGYDSLSNETLILSDRNDEEISRFTLDNKESFIDNFLPSGEYFISVLPESNWIKNIKCTNGQKVDSLPAKINIYDGVLSVCYLSDKPLEAYSWQDKKNMFAFPPIEGNFSAYVFLNNYDPVISGASPVFKISLIGYDPLEEFGLGHGDGVSLGLSGGQHVMNVIEEKDGWIFDQIICGEEVSKSKEIKINVSAEEKKCTIFYNKIRAIIPQNDIALEQKINALNQIGSTNSLLVSGVLANKISNKLTIGQKNGEVINLQIILYEQGFYKGNIDGHFGPKTLLAVKAFQWKNKLTQDGIVGPKTREVLNRLIVSNN